MYSTMNQNTKTEQISNEIKNQLKNRAVLRFGIILPVNENLSLKDSYTIEKNHNTVFYIFWFNDIGGSTHIETITTNLN